MAKEYHDKIQPEDEAAILMYDPVDSLALIEIAAAPHLQAAKIDLTLDRDGLLAILP
jgi:hypothetical protein